jgi:pimeloyl-ACP methyl ester carboxylesterase
MAYAQMHASKPQTAAYGLTDSPAGLAAWIVEKFRRWGDTGGELARRFSPDELLTNLTICWATGTIHSSIRLYYETVREPARWGKPETPVAMLMTPKDMFATPREWAARSYNIRRWTEVAAGGHFLEQEEPDAVAADLRAFAATLT